MSNTDVEKLVCQICNQECTGYRGLGKHVEQKHLDINFKSYYLKYLTCDANFKCPYCDNERNFRTLKYGFSPVCTNKSCLGKYIDSCKKNKGAIREKHYGDYTCKICNKYFDKIESLQAHLFKSAKQETSCHKGTLTSKDYYLKFLAPKDLNILCPICKKEKYFKGMVLGFSNTCGSKQCIGKDSFRFYIKDVPIQKEFKNPIECQICHKIFETGKGLTSHLSQNQNDHFTLEEYYLKFLKPDLNIICPFCNKNRRKFVDIVDGYTGTCCEIKCITELIFQTKVKNKSFLGNGYSMFPIKNIFNPVIEQLHLDQNRCKHALLNKEFIRNVGNIKEFAKRKINAISYDFAYLDTNLQTPLMICEFHGICFHLRKEEAWSKRREKDYFGNNLFKQYIKDILKKKYIQVQYPYCIYIEIWEDNIKEGIQLFINSIRTILANDCDKAIKDLLKNFN